MWWHFYLWDFNVLSNFFVNRYFLFKFFYLPLNGNNFLLKILDILFYHYLHDDCYLHCCIFIVLSSTFFSFSQMCNSFMIRKQMSHAGITNHKNTIRICFSIWIYWETSVNVKISSFLVIYHCYMSVWWLNIIYLFLSYKYKFRIICLSLSFGIYKWFSGKK